MEARAHGKPANLSRNPLSATRHSGRPQSTGDGSEGRAMLKRYSAKAALERELERLIEE